MPVLPALPAVLASMTALGLWAVLLTAWPGAAGAAGQAAGAHAAHPATLADCDGDFQRLLQPDTTGPMPARAVWLDGRHLRWPQAPAAARYRLLQAGAGGLAVAEGTAASGVHAAVTLQPVPPPARDPVPWVGAGPALQVRGADAARLRALLRSPLVLVAEDAQGRVLQATATQTARALDDLYAAAATMPEPGVLPAAGRTTFRLWAPTARAVSLCLHADAEGPATQVLPLRRDDRTGAWLAAVPRDLRGGTYTYLVDVWVRSTGLVRNRVTDPYATSLNADSRRTWIGRLDDPALQPPGWATAPRPPPLRAAVDQAIYELHVRDFSVADDTVPAAQRGKYLAFTHGDSAGMRHLRALAGAGITHVHLLPVFDLASVPERGCMTPEVSGTPDGPQQQAAVRAAAARDCYNWGYDPWHYTAPEGSYATDANDGAVRILEFRRMVQALHAAGLRVGMDMVYNHTVAAGQDPRSVLDRIVPGYYQRLDADGQVETSTCCANTATEHRMMARLMIDSAVSWVRHHRIDGMRFDLMGHQPRDAMVRLQRAVDRAAGRRVHLIGEGWNFGEVKDGARFVQAAQGRLSGTGIATFSDRGRDAVRGGGCCDDAAGTLSRQGWITGLHLAPNPHAPPTTATDLMRTADLVRVALAGTLRDVRLRTHDGRELPLSTIAYAGQGAGYASRPDEVVNYVENHDNPTLFDIAQLKLPPGTSMDDRARVQLLGLAVTAFSQGIAYLHAGVDILRSKSGDRNSYDSGDWFNAIDWSYTSNGWGRGLPPEPENGALWPALQPLLADPAMKPGPAHIAFVRDAFQDLLRIRGSSTLFRLRSAADVQRRLAFLNTGASQDPAVIVARLDGRGLAGAGWDEVLYAINVGPQPAQLRLPEVQGRRYELHPVHRSASATDRRPAEQARWDAATGTLTVPARTAVVWVAAR